MLRLRIGWLAIAVCLLGYVSASGQRIVFTNLTGDDGIAYGGIGGIHQDAEGYIWAADREGLKRYDGYEVRGFDVAASGAVPSAFLSDSNGVLWLGTRNAGLFCFDPKRRLDLPLPPSFSSIGENITALYEDQRRTLWIGTHAGLLRADSPDQPIWTPKRSGDSMTVLHETPDGTLWTGSSGGVLYQIAPGGQSAVEIWKAGAAITGILTSAESGLWISTAGKGLYQLSADMLPRNHFTANPADPTTLPSNTINSLFRDSTEGLWLGTESGLSRYFPSTGKFYTYRGDPDDTRSLPSDRITHIYEDRGNVLWIGTHAGVSRFALKQRFFERIKHHAGRKGTVSHDSIQAIFADSRGRMWLAAEDGLNMSDSPYSGYRKFKVLPDSPLYGHSITALGEDRYGNMWMGTDGGGLVRMDSGNGALQPFVRDPENPHSLPDNHISAFTVDGNGDLWIGTRNGVVRHSPKANQFIGSPLEVTFVDDLHTDFSGRIWVASGNSLHAFNPATPGGAPATVLPSYTLNAAICTIRTGDDGNLWIGTYAGGLWKLVPTTGEFFHWTRTTSGLPDDDVLSIEPDGHGSLWLGTGNGLARFDPATGNFRAFSRDDGLQSMVFHPRSSTKDKSGRLYFGGPLGMNIIQHDRIPMLPPSTPPRLTGLEIDGATIVPSPKHPILKQPLAATEQLAITWKQRGRLGLSFATLDYTVSSRGHFRYRLLPIEENWISSEQQRKTTYPTLPHGDYTFEVQSSPDGTSWNEETTSLSIRVQPPWYRSAWAYAVFCTIGLGLIVGGFRIFVVAKLRKALKAKEKLESAVSAHVSRAMLLQRMSEETHDHSGGDPFGPFLDHVHEHFHIDRCSIHAYDADPAPALTLLAENTEKGSKHASLAEIDASHPLIQRILQTSSPVTSDDVGSDTMLGETRHALRAIGLKSLLAVRTTHLGHPNGMLMLLNFEESHPWLPEDIRLIEAVAGQIGTAIANHQFIQEDKKQKEELAEARQAAEIANQAKSDFLATMTHELRTPLNAILGFSQLLEQDGSFNEEQRRNIGIINHSGEHLLDIINDILEMSKIESGSCDLCEERFDLTKLLLSIEQMLGMKAESKGLYLKFDRQADVPQWVVSDKGKLRQILVNLLGNALKFTMEGGITVNIKRLADPMLDGGRFRLRFEIIDTGTGIAEEEIPLLFERFAQTESGRKSHQGTGLGLPITKTFVELMGGEIKVRSKQGEGTEFDFEIIAEKSHADPEEEVPIVENRPVSGIASDQDTVRILIAEDQPANRLLLSTLLRKAGFEVDEAENGQMAVDLWRKTEPDIIFMDQEMPIMDGNEATRTITAACQSEPLRKKSAIISLTAHALEDSRKAALDAGCIDFLSKPFKHEDLFEIIAKHANVRYDYAEV